jgi:hypothetical protein
MKALKGTYHKGKLRLEEPVNSDIPLKVIVTFLEEEEKKQEKKFSFAEARKLLSDYKGSLSAAIIEERNLER